MARLKNEILDDIRKLYELGSALRFIGAGWTIRQRIRHHQSLAKSIQEFMDAGGTVEEVMMVEK